MKPDSECTRCGRCCLNMRQYIIIESDFQNGRMRCRCVLTREQFQVFLSDRDLRRMYDPMFMIKNPKACPFLTKTEQDIYSCIIYSSRPGHCRSFSCVAGEEEKNIK